jgi:putative restriction endonuclease
MSKAQGTARTRDELILAINLYCRTPFGKIHQTNPDIVAMAELLGRSPGSVGYKLANFASIDPSLARKGMANASKLDKAVWAEFFENWDAMAFESEQRMAELTGDAIGESVAAEERTEYSLNIPEGKSRDAMVKQRVNQGFFRRMILASYGQKCCLTGLALPSLLNASHIVPWAAEVSSRTDPRNGLCLNALHDRAFDRGLITVGENRQVVVSSAVMEVAREDATAIQEVAGRELVEPGRFLPDPNYLAYHREHVFVG